MRKLTEKNEVQGWFRQNDFEGSILIYFKINLPKKEVWLITSYPMGLKTEYQYKFRLTKFVNIKEINRTTPVSKIYRANENFFQVNLSKGSLELDNIELKSYSDNFKITLDFGHNYGKCEFQFQSIETEIKKGKIVTSKQEHTIIDLDSNQIIDFDSPFNRPPSYL